MNRDLRKFHFDQPEMYVFSVSVVSSLYDLSMKVLIENVDGECLKLFGNICNYMYYHNVCPYSANLIALFIGIIQQQYLYSYTSMCDSLELED